MSNLKNNQSKLDHVTNKLIESSQSKPDHVTIIYYYFELTWIMMSTEDLDELIFQHLHFVTIYFVYI